MGVPKTSKMQRRLAGQPAVTNRFVHHGMITSAAATKVALAKQSQEAVTKEALAAPKRVIFMSRENAISHEFTENDVLISISDTKTEAPKFDFQPVDMVELHFNDDVSARDEDMGLRWMMMEDGIKVAQFVAKHTDKRNIIVHCNYGESRSKAVAMAIAAYQDRAVLRPNHAWGGDLIAYREKDDVGNRRVYEITLGSLELSSEEEFAQ